MSGGRAIAKSGMSWSAVCVVKSEEELGIRIQEPHTRASPVNLEIRPVNVCYATYVTLLLYQIIVSDIVYNVSSVLLTYPEGFTFRFFEIDFSPSSFRILKCGPQPGFSSNVGFAIGIPYRDSLYVENHCRRTILNC